MCFSESPNHLLIKALNQSCIKQNLLLEQSNVTERMLEHIKSGMHPSKESILAIAISLGLNIAEIQAMLKSFGYVLSQSLPNDMVVLYLLEHNDCNNKENSLVWYINNTLEELNLPLLGTKF